MIMTEEETKLYADLSASFYRQMFFMRICKIENQWFASSSQMAKPMFKAVHRIIKNGISNISALEEQAMKILPNSADKIRETVDDNKVLIISSIVEKMSYMSIEQLEDMDEQIRLVPENEIST